MSSVEPQTPYTEHVGNGVTTAFSYEFQLLASDDLIVTIDDVVIPSSDFVLTGVGNQAGGDVTFTVAPVNGAVVLLSRTIALKRDIDYQYNGALAEQTVDLDFNRLWQALQGAMAIVGGAIRAPFPEQIPALPKASARANTLLGFDASGNPIVTTPSPTDATAVSLALQAFINSISDSADPASADALLALKRTSTGGVASTWHAWLEKQPVNPRAEFGVVGDGVANDYAQMVVADAAAAALGGVLVLGPGRYRIDTNLAFSVPVVMEGGVFAGSGTLSFPAGFSAPAYYCFDCPVGAIRVDAVRAEWFGARQSVATPTSTSVDVSAKAWNAWPAWVTGASFGTDPGHDYGDAAYLAANKPFANGDTWDFIAIQRALWAVGQVTTGGRGVVGLFAATYKLSRPLRWTGEMAANLSGAGYTKTILDAASWPTHGTVQTDSTVARAILHFYRSGPDPILLDGFAMTGPAGYVYGSEATPIFLATMIGANGVQFSQVWAAVADAGFYMGASSSDISIREVHSEYCRRTVYGYDALSWCQIDDCKFWQSGAASQAIDVQRYVFVSGLTLVGYTLEPLVYGEGSRFTGVTLIQAGTDFKTHIDGAMIRRRVRVVAGATGVVLSVQMPQNSAMRTHTTVGGVMQGLGAAGIERTLTWYRSAVAPVAGGAAATEWGEAGAIAAIAAGVTTTAGGEFSITLVNTGAAGQDFDGWVTITFEGSDCAVKALT